MQSERTELIAAIREAPDDDAVRLVCADWFEEQGDEASVARAEFIRLQVQRANLPPEDLQHSELQARELRLLKRYGPIWCGSHFLFRKVRFRRGFIEYVHLHLQHFQHHRRQMLDLEPVRDIRLTGWHRAPTDLIRRVAACEEWKYVETLRIHHQGPHKDPKSNLVDLLESPHLTRLTALHGTPVEFDADARRRFERLPLLRQVRDFHFPTLDRYPHQPGDWFANGGATFANQWGDLRSLVLPDPLLSMPLRHVCEMSWWNRLTALELVIPIHRETEALTILSDRLPKGLRELRLSARHSPADLSALGQFLERLALVPLRSLRLSWIPIAAATLARLLDGTNQWGLEELSLNSCHLTEEHAQVIAESPGARGLLSLDLGDNGDCDSAALFSGQPLPSLVHLALNWTTLGSEGARVFASAVGWDRLRSLDISETELGQRSLQTLLKSPNLLRLNWLVAGGERPGTRRYLSVSPITARAISELPNLASLELETCRLEAGSKQVLSQSTALAWVTISTSADDVQTWRAMRAPERTPPLDGPFARDP
jgi:uncharacterized protein (TIGR02996 family)